MAVPSNSRVSGRFLARVAFEGYYPRDQISFRCNGRHFEVYLSPCYFGADSPAIQARYRKYMDAWKELNGEEDENGRRIDDEAGGGRPEDLVNGKKEGSGDDDDDGALGETPESPSDPETIIGEFREWVLAACRPVFSELAPDVPPSFDPEKLRTGEATALLSEYLFPQEYHYKFTAVQDRPVLERCPGPEDDDYDADQEPEVRGRFSVALKKYLRQDLLEELQRHVPFIDACEVEVAFADPEHALYKMPKRVEVPDLSTYRSSPSSAQDLGRRTRKSTCYFKRFTWNEFMALGEELEAHLRVLKSNNLARDLRVFRLLGVVTATAGSEIAGLLLTYVDSDTRNVLGRSYQLTSLQLRQRWATQIRDTVTQLHEAGLVWDDATAGNLMVDRNDDLWIVDFGIGRIGGWVDRDKQGTKEGDLQGLERILEFFLGDGHEGGRWGVSRYPDTP